MAHTRHIAPSVIHTTDERAFTTYIALHPIFEEKELRRILFCLLFFCSFAAFADGPTAGALTMQTGGTIPVGPYTYLDVVHPVTADGNIDTVVTRWLTDNACSDEVKIRFFRTGIRGISGELTLVGAAGPFAATNNVNVFTFSPIAVQRGDLLAITQLKTPCGGVTWSASDDADVVYEIGGDFNGGLLNNVSVQARRGYALNAVASQGPSRLIGTIPVVGSAPGNFGSFFRTALTLSNTSGYSMNIRLVFHPAGAAASTSDPSTTFALAPRATKNFADVVQSMSLTGLGSLDIYSDAYEPVVIARIFNDAAAAGTSGFTEDVVKSSDGYERDEFFYAPLPTDLENFRVNIGIRTFGAATIVCGVYRADGTYAGPGATRTYPANFFEQVSLATLTGGITPPAGGMLQFYVESGGPVVLYTATTDNRTNDGSLKMYTFK